MKKSFLLSSIVHAIVLSVNVFIFANMVYVLSAESNLLISNSNLVSITTRTTIFANHLILKL